MSKVPRDFIAPPTTPPADLRTSDFPIGLSLSGGGYRAAAFHLGTLAYLHRVGLLPQMSRLSTVSGGTFTGAKYILSLVEGEPFSKFFQEFYGFLCQATLIKDALNGLSKGSVEVPSGEQKFITAIANVYDRTFLRMRSGAPYTLGQIMEADIPVKEVIFNATEFRTGVAFRFQKSENIYARIGNGNVYIPREDAKHIRIADIVAASSCFPGGFEPLSFPTDFVWPDNQVPESVTTAINKEFSDDEITIQNGELNIEKKPDITDKAVAIMDGGIYDNQGIASLLLPDDRKHPEELGMFIISDVDSKNENLFSYPEKQNSSGKITLGQIDWLIRIFLVTCALTVLSVGYELWREIVQGTFIFWQHFFSALMPVILASLVTLTLAFGRRLIRRHILPMIPQVGANAWKNLKTLEIDEFIYIMKLRIDSLMALTRAVFMDRIKSLIFEKVYDDKRYHGKRVSNRIDRLIDVSRPPEAIVGVSQVSAGLREQVLGAVNMPTTLWFDANQANKEFRMKSLVVTGQATICFNLMQYLVRRYGEDAKKYPPTIQKLWLELQKDWEILNAQPTSLVNDLLK